MWKRAPGLALTPTATRTPVPGTTPTATRTPFSPPVPTPTGSPVATPTPSPTPIPPCNWAGAWDTTSGGQRFPLALSQSGGAVSGSYGPAERPTERRLEATAAGYTLRGRWAGPPTFAEPDHAGRFFFTAAANCNAFSGTWGFNTRDVGGGDWSGTRAGVPGAAPSLAQRTAQVAELYRTVLCREPDPAGLVSWVLSELPVAQVRALLAASGEGQRVEGVRGAYLGVLARDPLPGDCGGVRGWVDAGLGLPEVRAGLLLSGEGQRVAAVRALYVELLGRDPLGSDNAGLRGWVDSPYSMEEVRQAILASPEYRRRVGSATAAHGELVEP